MVTYPRTWIEIQLPALVHNLGVINEQLSGSTLLALVVKADGYGHGLVPISRCAVQNGVDWICVATVPEGITLRDSGIQEPILVLSPILEIEAAQAVFYGLRVCVERLETARALSNAAVSQGKIAIVHLEIDTGLLRFGCESEFAVETAISISSLPSLELEALCQHFIDSGSNFDRTKSQLHKFSEVTALVEESLGRKLMRHASNSAGAFKFHDAHFDMVRVGIAAYGIDPYMMVELPLIPVMNWYCRITAIRDAKAGDTVGYSETFVLNQDARIATIGVGYGDGYPRSLSSEGHVSLRGCLAPIVGLVCMDQAMIDVTKIPEVEIGDIVTLIGLGESCPVSVEDLARDAKTNCHEITTRIMARVPRRIIR